MAEFRFSFPQRGEVFEVGQQVEINLGPPGEHDHPDRMFPGVIKQVVDIGERIGLVLDVPDDSPLAKLPGDEWMVHLLDNPNG
jgi:ribosomal protein L21E